MGRGTSRRTRDLASPAGVRQRSRPHLCAVPHVPALAPRQMCRPQGSRHQPPRQGAGNLGLPRLPSDASRNAPRGPEAADPACPTRTPTNTDTTATTANGEERRDPDGGNGTTGAAAGSTPSRDDRTTAGEKRLTAAQDTAVKLQRSGRPTNRAPEAQVVLLQETKLTAQDTEPRFPWYNVAARRDNPNETNQPTTPPSSPRPPPASDVPTRAGWTCKRRGPAARDSWCADCRARKKCTERTQPTIVPPGSATTAPTRTIAGHRGPRGRRWGEGRDIWHKHKC